ncbi:MAG: hypothetical protein ACRD5K_12135 [Candidatus Acidiferrales bacterium]
MSRAAFRLRHGIAFISLILAAMFVVTPLPARAANSNLAARAQPLGKPLSTIIEFGEQYETGDALYEAKITVVKVLRGAPAEALVKAASASNPSAKTGFEFMAARVRFDFSARVTPAHDEYTLDASQFSSISPDGSMYPAPNLAARPEPGLHGTVRSGGSVEGWVVLLVPHSDPTPLMLFVPNLGSTSHQGGSSVFRLYAAVLLGSGEKSS